MRRYLLVLAAVLAAGLLVASRRPVPTVRAAPAAAISAEAPAPLRRSGRPRRGGMDLTFLVTTDTHAGFSGPIPVPGQPEGVGLEAVHQRIIETMNALPGTALPAGLGTVGTPRGVLVAGDLTEGGWRSHWERFVAMYGLTGKEGWLRYPVYEGIGNHDLWDGPYVKQEVAKRHGGSPYSWDWDDVHLVSLGEAPNDADLAWLAADLERTGPSVGVVLFFHYPLDGYGTHDNWFGRDAHREALAKALAGYRVLGIFHGHAHQSGFYRWRGIDVYKEGSPKHAWHSYAVVRVTDERWTVASYNYDRRAYWWWHHKPVFGTAGREASWTSGDRP